MTNTKKFILTPIVTAILLSGCNSNDDDPVAANHLPIIPML